MGRIKGRPKKAIVQEKNIGFFVTHAQYFIIQQKAAIAGVNISEYMRQAAVFGQVKKRWTPEERELFKKMVSMSNDLHQLTAIAKREGILSAMVDFERYRDAIDAVVKRMSDDK